MTLGLTFFIIGFVLIYWVGALGSPPNVASTQLSQPKAT